MQRFRRRRRDRVVTCQSQNKLTNVKNMGSNCKQRSENCNLSRIINKFIRHPTIRKDGSVIGFIDSSGTFSQFVEELRGYGIIFSVRTSVGTDNRLLYSLQTDNFSIPYNGTPFRVERTTHYQCAFGVKYFPSKSIPHKENHQKKVSKRNYKSKKHNCPARMVVKHLNLFTRYKAESNNWRKKQEVLQKLRGDFTLKNCVPVDRFMILISSEASHNHLPRKPSHLLPVLIDCIRDLNSEGYHSTIKVKELLNGYVEKMFENSKKKPAHDDETYYPTYQAIYKHMRNLRKKVVSTDHQGNAVIENQVIDCGQEDRGEPDLNSTPENCNVELLPNSNDLLPVNSVSLPESQVTVNPAVSQMILLYPGNVTEHNIESLSAALYLQDGLPEENIAVVQENNEEITISDFTAGTVADTYNCILSEADISNVLPGSIACQLETVDHFQTFLLTESTETVIAVPDTSSENESLVQISYTGSTDVVNATHSLAEGVATVEDKERWKMGIQNFIKELSSRVSSLDTEMLRMVHDEMKGIVNVLTSCNESEIH